MFALWLIKAVLSTRMAKSEIAVPRAIAVSSSVLQGFSCEDPPFFEHYIRLDLP